MSEQELDLRRSMRIVWRHKILVGVLTVLGLAAGVEYTAHHPPMPTSTALVLLAPSTHDTLTQVVIASSDPVLTSALRSADLGASVTTLRNRLTVKSPTYNVISITALGKTAAQAERTANAVAHSYVAYVGLHAQVLQSAKDSTETSLAVPMLAAASLGALSGLLVGAILALAISRSDRRLRERNEIAESIGAPVLASIPVIQPHATAGWRKLLETYEPGDLDAWHLRRALKYLGLADGDGSSPSITILSLSSDRKALALGPQLAGFAASVGIPTTLVIGPQQDVNAAAMLRAACTSPLASPSLTNLRVVVRDRANTKVPPAVLSVVVAVVDGKAPNLNGMIRTTATVLGVSAGAATAETLARVAASADIAGRRIAGTFVADPDSSDHTTGRLPQLLLPAQRRAPIGANGAQTEIKR